MLNYKAISSIIQSSYFVDKTDFFAKFCGNSRNWEIIENCKNSGSTLFLKSLACFLDKRIDSKDIFRNLNVGKSDFFDKTVNSYTVLYIDFSDCNSQTYDEFLEYIGIKMSDLYKEYYKAFKIGNFFDVYDLKMEINIIERTAKESELQNSLPHLARRFHEYESYNDDNKLAVLIDNLIQAEYCSVKYGYQKQFNNFLDKFRLEDVYKKCDLFVQIGDYPDSVNHYNRFHDYCVGYSYCYWGGFVSDLHDDERCYKLDNFAVAPESQYEFEYEPISPFPDFDWDKFICDSRITIDNELERQRLEKIEYIKWEKERYAADLSNDVPKFSDYLGIRKFVTDKTSKRYIEMNDKLKDLYRKFSPDFNQSDIYWSFQNIDNKTETLYDRKKILLLENLANLEDDNSPWRHLRVQDDGYWIQCTFDRKISKTNVASCRNIKAYVCMDTPEIQDVFVNSIKYLFSKAQNSFGAKVATCNRNDQMCYWLNKEDFAHLQDYYAPFSKNMKQSLWFVAYYNNFGISRDFPDVDSHNGIEANIISDYFKTVRNEDDVDLEAMYNNYVMKWNNDIYQEESFGGFKNYTAMSFVIIMETLDVLLAKKQFDDNSILLNDDPNIWIPLADSRCWRDLNDNWHKNNKK